MGCFVVAEFLLTSASAIAEPLFLPSHNFPVFILLVVLIICINLTYLSSLPDVVHHVVIAMFDIYLY